MQAVLLSGIAILTAIMLFRVVVFFRNQYAGLSYCYPGSWTNAQIKVFGRLRLSIGACLGITWLTLLIAAPQLPAVAARSFELGKISSGKISFPDRFCSCRAVVDRRLVSNSCDDRVGDNTAHPFHFSPRHNSLGAGYLIRIQSGDSPGIFVSRPVARRQAR
jgi:hypothetical protein